MKQSFEMCGKKEGEGRWEYWRSGTEMRLSRSAQAHTHTRTKTVRTEQSHCFVGPFNCLFVKNSPPTKERKRGKGGGRILGSDWCPVSQNCDCPHGSKYVLAPPPPVRQKDPGCRQFRFCSNMAHMTRSCCSLEPAATNKQE